MTGKYTQHLWINRIGFLCQSVLLMLCICSVPALSAEKHKPVRHSYVLANKQVTHSYTLKDFGYLDGMRLHGIYDIRKLNFGIRLDESVVSMQVRLKYSMSPALLRTISQINIKINGFPVQSLTVGDILKRHGSVVVNIDPNLLQEYNQLAFEFIGHYTLRCEDPDHTSLWAVLGKTTEITLHALKLNGKDSLAQLPYPFFDKHDRAKLNIPFVFVDKPTLPALKAAGILASWFGKMADYRGAEFPELSGTLPASGNAIVLMSGNDRIAGVDISAPKELASLTGDTPNAQTTYSPVGKLIAHSSNPYSLTGPTIVIRPNPNDPYGRLLIISGRDEAEMVEAAQALVLGRLVISGHRAVVKKLDVPVVRKPYDAPRWLPDDRPVRFSELSGRDELQVQGVWPGPIRVHFRMPPDLFKGHGYEPTLKMRYRYSIPQKAEQARLNVKFNEQFLESYPLVQDGQKYGRYWLLKVRSFLSGDNSVYESLKIPASKFGFYNQFKFHFLDLRMKEGECKQIPTNYFEGMIDPDSTIDISDTPHFTRMPNIGMFVDGGFPFTRMADLSETVVVMPDVPDAGSVSSFLQIMGMMGASTGFPAVHVAVTHAADIGQYADKDILIIGALDKQPLLSRWENLMPVSEVAGRIRLKEPNSFQFMGSLFTADDRRQGGEILLKSSKDIGLLTSFESPMKKGRTVVVVTSTKNNILTRLADQMALLPSARSAQGDTLIINGEDNVSTLNLADSYYVGSLPLWAKLKWWLANSPLIMLVMIIVAVALLALILFTLFTAREKRRLIKDRNG